jgi:uncharacterized protein (TIGR03084 family)
MTSEAGTAGAVALSQAFDFLDECDALHAALVSAPAEAWRRPTQFKQWAFDDVLGHLHMFDHASLLATRSRDELQAFLRQLMTGRAGGKSLTVYTREWLDGCTGPALLERWRDGYREVADTFSRLDPHVRLAWVGPDMSARSFVSARQMEAWSHGQAMFDLLGLERQEHDRLRNVAVMGVNTFGWSFTVNERDVPPTPPYVRLASPSGAVWEWNDPDSADRVEGTAVDFCRVVTQTRNALDTALRLTGPVATEWMSIAQCFAGPRETPPAPGTRYAVRRGSD